MDIIEECRNGTYRRKGWEIDNDSPSSDYDMSSVSGFGSDSNKSESKGNSVG
jgi:hypothetical protein